MSTQTKENEFSSHPQDKKEMDQTSQDRANIIEQLHATLKESKQVIGLLTTYLQNMPCWHPENLNEVFKGTGLCVWCYAKDSHTADCYLMESEKDRSPKGSEKETKNVC